MKTFIQWAKVKNLPLPEIAENTKRAGMSQNYPPNYVRGQYPSNYFTPIAADAPYKLSAKPNTPKNTAAK